MANIDPALQERARTIVTGVGQEALTGAVAGAKEASGLVRVDADGQERLSKRGVVRAVFRPKTTLAKTAWGAAKGGKEAAVAEARMQVDTVGDEIQSTAVDGAANNVSSAAGEPGWNNYQPTAEVSHAPDPPKPKRSFSYDVAPRFAGQSNDIGISE